MDSISRFASPLLNGLALTLALAACSSDKTAGSTPAMTGGAAGVGAAGAGTGGAVVAMGGTPTAGGAPAAGGAATGGVAPAGGAGGAAGAAGGAGGTTGGAGGSSGAGNGGVGGDYYFCENRMPSDPGGTGMKDATCCGGVGKCADKTTLTGDAVAAYGHDTCDKTLLCAPPTPTAAPASCTTKVGTSVPDGIEGRCVPKCFLLGNPQAPLLDDGGTCPAMQVCAPCYSPVDAKSTGACNTGTDKPVKPAPTPYVACPKGNDAGQDMGGGLCVPESVVNKLSDKNSALYNPAIPGLKQDNCAMGEKCVPAKKATDPGYCSQQCTTSMKLQTLSPALKNGACTPEYVIFDTNGMNGVTLTEPDMGAMPCTTPGERCAPCSNPLTGGTPSGACY